MTTKTIDGVTIKCYSVRKDYSKRRMQGILIVLLSIFCIALIALGEMIQGTNKLIEETGTIISNKN